MRVTSRLPGTLLGLLAMAALPLARVAGAEQGAGGASPPLRFLRVYAPADRLQDWPLDQGHYPPIPRDEFERLVKAARADATLVRASLAASLTAAQYQARLVGEELTQGEAALEVSHAAEAPVLLRLDPCRLPVRQPRWTHPAGKPAQVGLGVDGSVQVLVERAGRLEFEWSLRGRRDAAGVIAFLPESPACPANRWLLELPAHTEPAVDRGVVTQQGPGKDGTMRWHIDTGGHPRFELRVVPTDEANRRRQMPVVRQSLVYDFSLHGVTLSAQWRLDVPSEPLRHVAVALDPGLQLISARYGDAPLRWSVVGGGTVGQARRVVLELPEPIRGMDRGLRLGAVAPLKTGQRWTLPRIRPEAMFWQEGGATLLVPAPLVVEQLALRHARQTKIAPLAAPRAGESLELQYFGPDAAVEVLLGQADSPLLVDSGTALEFRRGEIGGRVVAAFRVGEGERFLLEADVQRPWIVDHVESIPPDALDDWNVDRRGPRPTLKIRLAKAVSPTRPVRLVFSVRRLGAPLGQPWRADDLAPLRFPAAAPGHRLLAVHAAAPFRLKRRGAERLALLKPQDLAAAQRELFIETPRDLLVEHQAAADLEVAMEVPKASYSATIRVEAMAHGGLLSESYWFECVPGGVPVDRLLVHFSTRRSTPLRWMLGAGEEDQLVARRLHAPAEGSTAQGAGETWEITLRRPRTLRFELRAVRASPLSDKQPLCLASLPEAAAERATLVLRSTGSTALRIENHRLQPIVPEAVADHQVQTVLAAYRYDPTTDAEAASPPAVLAALPAHNGLPAVWVWDGQVESRYEADGRGRHRAVYRLESRGAGQWELALPPETDGSAIQGVWVDAARAGWRLGGDEAQQRLLIDLPPQQKFPVVSILFTTPPRTLRIVDRLLAPIPEPAVPVLGRHWTVWLPPGLETAEPDPLRQAAHAPSLSWSQRLFGPLGRGPEQRPFAFLRASAWSRLVLADPAWQSAERRAVRLLQEMGHLAAQGDTTRQPKTLDWGTLLTDQAVGLALTDDSNETAALALLIDRQALWQMGLGPRTSVQAALSDTPAKRGAHLLSLAGLALLVHRDALVLTSAARAALLLGKHLAATEREALWAIQPGPLAEQVEAALASGGEGALMPVAVWDKRPGDPPLPWRASPLADVGVPDNAGWTVHRLELAGEAPWGLSVARGPAVRALRWVAFLLVVSLAWWTRGAPARVWLLLLGVSASAALFLPEGYASIPSGMFLGILASLGVRLLSGRPRPEPPDVDSPSGTQPAASAGVAPLVGVLLAAGAGAVLFGSAARGAEPAPERPTETTPVPRVFIPVDERQQPVGDKIYVPETLYGELQRRAARRAEQPQGWLLSGGTYRGALAWQGTPERLELSELRATFEMHVFGHGARVRLPLLRDQTNLAPEGLLLDGRALAPAWDERTGELSLSLPEAGQYRLELSFQPAAQRNGPSSGFELRIPRLPSSRLELAIPADAPAIEVSPASGSVAVGGDPPRLTADLGPADRLAVRWPEGARHGAAGPAMDLEALLWLKVQPGSVTLDARLKLKVVQGRVSQVQLVADPRLRLLPSNRPDSPIAQVHTSSGQAQTLRVELARPVSDQVVLEMTFLLTETSGVGNLRLPSLALPEARIVKRWMAVSVDPGLQYEQAASGRLEPVAVPDFAGAWGTADSPPLFAYSLSSGEPAWSLSTRPCEPSIASDQLLALSVGEQEARLLLDARLTTTAGASFQYRLSAPAALIVDSLSVTEAGAERAARWSRDKDGSVVVFLAAPATGQQDLSLRGRLPIAAGGQLSLALPRLEGAMTRSYLVQLFRQPAVEVTASEATGLAETEAPPMDEGKLALGRLVKCWSVGQATPAGGAGPQGKVPSLEIRCRPNRPQVRFEQITWLRNRGEEWEAEVAVWVRASGGVVDALTLDVPPEWPGPYQLSPPTAARAIAPAPGLLVVRPPTAIDGELRLAISGPLAIPAGQRPAAPRITLQGAEPSRRLLVLPTQAQLQPIAWETQGLQQTPLPAQLLPASTAEEAWVAYEVREEAFRAVLSTQGLPGGAPQVYLADISFAWQAGGAFRGAAVFDLGPVELSECTLRLPPGQRLVQVTSPTAPTPPVPAGDGRWRVALGHGGLPQRIEVLFSGSLSEAPGSETIRCDAPTLEGLPVRQTLWTLACPPSRDLQPPASLQASDRLQHALIRLQSAGALIEQGADLPGRDAENLLRWYRQMAHRWAALAREVERLLAAAPDDASQNAQRELQAIVRRQWRMADRVGGTQILSQEMAGTPTADAAPDLWLGTSDRPDDVTRLVAAGGALSLELSCRPAQGLRLAPRLWAAAAIWALIGLAALTLRTGTLGAVLARWPNLALLAAALGWWLWLEPSALGLAGAAVFLVGALASAGKRRGERAGGAGPAV